jgi:hypothetical protein
MKKKIIICLAALIGMSGLWGMFVSLLNTWDTRSLIHKIIGLFALMGWGYITYYLITLKYKWIRKLAE